MLHKCPLCSSSYIEYRFIVNGHVISACNECGHIFANPQHDSPDNSLFTPLYSPDEKGSTDILFIDNLDLVNDPYVLLEDVHERLNDGDGILLFVPLLESENAKRERQKWAAFQQNRLHFFSFKTLNNILCKCGFGNIEIVSSNKNGVFVHALRRTKNNTLSFIIPVYNEEATVKELLASVYAKDISNLGLKKEMIIIESNSTDGTREIVKEFAADHDDVKLILEDRPKGKGHAVRNGFTAATGDFIAIQDGDLEYDINDYDKLLLPLVNYREAFVLGSRHTGDWRMRKFGEGEKGIAAFMNAGQIFFTWMINFGCKVKLKDPFTMFKLFRRECLYGLKFDGNRFEIDWEILIKLIRKGFKPYEIPVNYSSRGFDKGKKVRIFRDPLLWIINFVRYRYLYKIQKGGAGCEQNKTAQDNP